MTQLAGLTGRTAVVTGTAHGIGAAIAQALRDQGAAVHGVDKDVADLTSPEDAQALFTRNVPPGVSVVDELLRERREEAERE